VAAAHAHDHVAGIEANDIISLRESLQESPRRFAGGFGSHLVP